jgi:hypothetical protein
MASFSLPASTSARPTVRRSRTTSSRLGFAGSRGRGGQNDGKVGRWLPNSTHCNHIESGKKMLRGSKISLTRMTPPPPPPSAEPLLAQRQELGALVRHPLRVGPGGCSCSGPGGCSGCGPGAREPPVGLSRRCESHRASAARSTRGRQSSPCTTLARHSGVRTKMSSCPAAWADWWMTICTHICQYYREPAISVYPYVQWMTADLQRGES